MTARAIDRNGVSSINLRYRIDPNPTYTDVPMVDNGTAGDAIANDGIFSAQIPAQAAGEMAAFYEDVAAAVPADAKLAANWVMGELSSLLNKDNLEIEQSPVSAQHLGEMILRATAGAMIGEVAKRMRAQLEAA